MGLWSWLMGKGWTPAAPTATLAPVILPSGEATVEAVESVVMPSGVRFVEYWTDTGALQRESDTPLPDYPAHVLADSPDWVAGLTLATVDYTPGAIWDAAARAYIVPTPPPAPAPSYVITKTALLRRIGLPVLSRLMALQATDSDVAALLFWINNVTTPDMSTIEAMMGAGKLASLNIPGAPTAQQLLAPAQPGEAP